MISVPSHIVIPDQAIEDFCRRHKIRELSLFGSVLRDDFGPDSDVDVLVDFEPGAAPSLFTVVQMQRDLAKILGRRVDLVTKRGLSPYIGPRILATREVLYVGKG